VLHPHTLEVPSQQLTRHVDQRFQRIPGRSRTLEAGAVDVGGVDGDPVEPLGPPHRLEEVGHEDGEGVGLLAR
jgi:hypothetical protein